MKTVTLDTNILAHSEELLIAGRKHGFQFARITVTDREVKNSSFQANLQPLDKVPETAVWGESKWGKAVWASEESYLEEILSIISNGSFPKIHHQLTSGQRRQLRDAMILEAHIREKRDIFVSNDERGFLRYGKREKLEAKFGTRIMSLAEFQEFLDSLDRCAPNST